MDLNLLKQQLASVNFPDAVREEIDRILWYAFERGHLDQNEKDRLNVLLTVQEIWDQQVIKKEEDFINIAEQYEKDVLDAQNQADLEYKELAEEIKSETQVVDALISMFEAEAK